MDWGWVDCVERRTLASVEGAPFLGTDGGADGVTDGNPVGPTGAVSGYWQRATSARHVRMRALLANEVTRGGKQPQRGSHRQSVVPSPLHAGAYQAMACGLAPPEPSGRTSQGGKPSGDYP